VSELSRGALAGVLKFQAFLALLVFLPSWSLRYREAWIYWTLFSTSVLAITLHFLRHDPGLIARRLEVGPGAEPARSQRIIQAVAGALFVALFVVAGLDHRLRASTLPIPFVLVADGLVLLAFLIIFLVFRENSHTGGVVRVEAGQRVISTGPYRWVRHPMYAGSALLFLATPPALGSTWALVVAVALCAAMVVRLLDEERILSANLPGYDDYRREVRHRLVPRVW
jgi:protein-S-isoprenylcysteine O-methyltransferase Ste14